MSDFKREFKHRKKPVKWEAKKGERVAVPGGIALFMRKAKGGAVVIMGHKGQGALRHVSTWEKA